MSTKMLNVRFPLIVLIVLFAGSTFVAADKLKCCGRVNGNCKRSCEQLAVLQEYPEDKIAGRITDFYNHCSPKNVRHIEWCMSSSAQDTEIKWLDAARKCCEVAKSDSCQMSCMNWNTKSRAVHKDCQDETEFFTCLQQHQVSDTCCGDKTDAVQCQIACEKFLASTPSINRHAADQEIIDLCTGPSKSLPHHRCSRNVTVQRASKRHNYLHCCKLAEDSLCEDACHRTLRRKFDSDNDAFDALDGRECGSAQLENRFWQCFIQAEGSSEPKDSSAYEPISQIGNLGMDSVKLHCCEKATIMGCRKLCLKTYTNEWQTSSHDLHSECLSHPNEEQLAKCMDDVDEPCSLGCDGLNYCTAFNNRPTELFRGCSKESDDAARSDYAGWRQSGTVTLFNNELPLKNITKCMPDSWKAVSCMMHVRPCTRQLHVNKICREDCLELLSRCLDWSGVAPTMSAESLCARLSSDPATGPCVPLRSFAGHAAVQSRPSAAIAAATTAVAQVTAPCKSKPCGEAAVCLVNRGCRVGGGGVPGACSPYRCVPACKSGEVSHYLIPEHSYARVPTAFSGQKGCAKACQCTARGVERCQQLPCAQAQACWLAGRQIAHGSTFKMECNTCSCYAGEMTCTKKHCEPVEQPAATNLVFSQFQHTGLPCNCPPHHVPVCGSNGNTYPNSCLAKCAGLSDLDLKFGTCWNEDPCAVKPCRPSERCVPARQVCLSMLKKSCVQYKCVSEKESCEDVPRIPVCDTDDIEHPNLCHLLLSKRTLAYSGPCLSGCSNVGQVCGADGNTYPSECAAFAESASVDYAGPCTSSGLVSQNGRLFCATNVVKCPKLPQHGCMGITPPGACCPKCAGALSILFSQKQVDRITHTLQKRASAVNALNTRSVIGALDRQVEAAECVTRGHLTVYQELLVLVEPTVARPTLLQLEACVREAERLATMMATSSPRFSADLSLSTLLSATPVHEPIAEGRGSASSVAGAGYAAAVVATLVALAVLVVV